MKKDQSGFTIVEAITAITLLSLISVITMTAIASATNVYGRKKQDFQTVEESYLSLEGALNKTVVVSKGGEISFRISGKEVAVPGNYRYTVDEEKEQATLVEFLPK